MFVKICGITNLEDAERSIELGATALGFNFYPDSPRFVELRRAAAIIQAARDEILNVGIVVGAPLEEEARVVDAFQVHGLDSPAEIVSHGLKVFVATSPEKIDSFPDHEIVIDVSWGTGKTADWNRLKKIQRPFILSGGLTPDNIAEAIQQLHPAGIDVCSGIESAPGKKDWVKLKDFMDAVENARSDVQTGPMFNSGKGGL